MYCCFQEELHRSFTEASQKLYRSFTEALQKLLCFTEMRCVRKKTSSVLGANDHLYIEDMARLVTERTVSFVLIGHIDTLKVQS
jgi:hypothetical protein